MTPAEITAWRQEAKLERLDLHHVLSITRQTVSNWESGSAKPPPFLHLAYIGWRSLRMPQATVEDHLVAVVRIVKARLGKDK